MLDLEEQRAHVPARSVDRPSDQKGAESEVNYGVSIVIPTRNEAGNIHLLLQRLDAAVGNHRAEVIFVDDSDDDTPAAIPRAKSPG